MESLPRNSESKHVHRTTLITGTICPQMPILFAAEAVRRVCAGSLVMAFLATPEADVGILGLETCPASFHTSTPLLVGGIFSRSVKIEAIVHRNGITLILAKAAARELWVKLVVPIHRLPLTRRSIY